VYRETAPGEIGERCKEDQAVDCSGCHGDWRKRRGPVVAVMWLFFIGSAVEWKRRL